LMVLSNKSLANSSRCLLESADKTNRSRFFSEAPWEQEKVNEKRIPYMLEETAECRRKAAQSCVIVDDTLCEHVGHMFEYGDRHYDHCEGRYPLGHNVVTTPFVSGAVRFPLDVRSRDEIGYLAYDAHFGTTRLLLFDTSTDFLQVPTIQLNSPMGSDVQLLGFSLPTTDSGDPKLSYHRQEVIPLVLFWRTRSALDISYTAFVHLVDQTGRPVLFADDEPDGGRRPTTSWTPSETIADLHNVLIPPTLPPGRYGIHVGLYDALTGRRLPVEPPHAEGLLLTTVAVEPPP